MTGHAARWEAAFMPNYATPELLLTRGQGAHVWDAQGTRYLDLLSGLAVNALGHAHPAVVQAVQEQVTELAHVSNLYATEPALALAERLSELTGGKQALLVNSGSEANEAAYKLVRRHAHQQGLEDGGVVVAFENSFHGRTTGALALTGQPGKQAGFGPFPDGVVTVPFNDPTALEAAFEAHPIAGVFAEVVQGEGGIVPMTQATADALTQLTQANDALLVVDEVQTGLGRTGKDLAHEHVGLDPDIVTLAKAIGGGLPVGACLATPELATLMDPGSHGCTFGGNPVACAAASATLEVYEQEKLGQRAAAVGGRLGKALDGHGLAHRGLGLLVGLPLDAPVAANVVSAMQAGGVLVGQAGNDVVRLSPPLVVDEGELLDAVPRLAEAVQGA